MRARDPDGRLEAALPAPFLNGQPHKLPERVKDQPKCKRETECEHHALERERKGGHPFAESGTHEFGIGVRAEVSELLEETRTQGVKGDLQTRHVLNEGLDDGALGMEGRIATRQVILDELTEATMMELVGKVLPWSEIGKRLVEPATESLPVLRDESGNQAAHDGGGQQ